MPINLSDYLGTTFQGLQGIQGTLGTLGSQGTLGTQGTIGSQGSQGTQGPITWQLTVGTSAPGSPSTNDLWVDTN
jgi:hypothetical protein